MGINPSNNWLNAVHGVEHIGSHCWLHEQLLDHANEVLLNRMQSDDVQVVSNFLVECFGKSTRVIRKSSGPNQNQELVAHPLQCVAISDYSWFRQFPHTQSWRISLHNPPDRHEAIVSAAHCACKISL